MLVRMQRKGNPLALLVGAQAAGTATLENSMEVFQKVKNRATLQPSNYTTWYLPKRYRCSDPKGHLHPSVYSNNIHKLWKEPRCPLTDEWIKKMWYIYTMEYYTAIKK